VDQRRVPGRPAPASAPPPTALSAARLLTAVVQVSLVFAGGAAGVAVVTLLGNSLRGQEGAFFAAFALALPAGYAAGERLANRAALRSQEHLALLAGAAAAGFLATVLAARLVYEVGGTTALPILLGAAALAAGASALVAYPPRRPPIRAARLVTRLAAVLLPLGVAAFLPERLLHPGPLAISLLGAAALVLVLTRTRHLHLPAWLGRALDVGALVLAVLWVMDVWGYVPHLPYDPHSLFTTRDLKPDDETFVLVIHQNFFLAPVNDILHGRAMLVDTYSQYGYGVMYFLAAFFKVAPLGYGPLTLLSGLLTGLGYAAGYAVLRMAGCRRTLALLTLAVAIVVAVFGTISSVVFFPSAGGVRYVLGYAVLLVVVAAVRWPRRAGALRMVALGIIAVASVWSVETFVVVAGTFAAVTAASAALEPGTWRERARRWARDLIPAAAVSVAALALFALLTLVFTGSRPHLRPYLAFFSVYRGTKVGLVGIPLVRPWSGGFAVIALYLASTVALVATVLRRDPVDRPDPWLVAAVGTTALGVLIFVYWVSHADPLAIPPLILPAIMVGALWVHRALPSVHAATRGFRLGGVALAGWLATLAVVFAWPQAEHKYKRTAAWQALPGAPSLLHDVRALWRSPRVDGRARDAERLLRQYFPGKGPALVVIEADLGVETLIRARRVNRIPVGYLEQDELISRWLLPRIDRSIRRIPPGTPMLIQLRDEPRTAYWEEPPIRTSIIVLLKRYFDLKLVASSPSGVAVVRLVPHGTAGAARI
jgi:hypothetical protein